MKQLRVYNAFVPLAIKMFTNTYRMPLDMWVSVPRVWWITLSINFCICTVSLICSVLLLKVFFFFFFFTKFPVGIILVFSRSLRLSFLNPDLPVVWQTKLSVRIAQFFPFPLLCLKSVQLKRVTFCYFFLPFFFFPLG